MQNTWLLYFLVNVVGLEPVVAGAVFVVARLFDAVNDPLIGDLIDRRVNTVPKLRWVRRTALPASVLFVAIFTAPLVGTQVLLLVLVALVVQSVFATFSVLASLSLIPVLARSYDDRTSIVSWRVAAGVLTTLVGISGPPAIVLAVTGDTDLAASDESGWVVMAVLLGLLMWAGFLLATRAIAEPPASGTATARLSRSLLRRYWHVPAFRSMMLILVVMNMALLVGTVTLPFFVGSVLGMTAGQQSVVLGAFFLTGAALLPVMAVLATRLGKSRALTAVSLVYVAGLSLFVILQPRWDEPAALVLVILVAGLGLSGVLVLPTAMVPDVVEVLEDVTEERREGLLFALAGFAVKLGGSLGILLASGITSLVGYQSGQSAQTSGARLGLSITIGPVASVIVLFGAWLALRSPLTRAGFEATVERLASRRAAVPFDR